MKIQIASKLFHMNLSVLKAILSLLEFKLGKNSTDYIYAKKEIMDSIYNGLKKLFKELEENKIIIKCECKHSLRKGYSSCEFCGGSGFKNI